MVRVPTPSTMQVASFLESWRQMKQMLVENKEHLGGYRIGTLVAARTVDGAVDLYMENEVFQVNTYILPSRLTIHRISVTDFITSLDGLYDKAVARLTTLGAMHGYRSTVSITQAMTMVMGDLKSLLGYSVHKTPHSHYSSPCAWWKRRVVAPVPQIPPPGDGPERRRHTFNAQMDRMIVRLAVDLRNSRSGRIPWREVERFNRTYPNVATRT